jgi:hypothetical protein
MNCFLIDRSTIFFYKKSLQEARKSKISNRKQEKVSEFKIFSDLKMKSTTEATEILLI